MEKAAVPTRLEDLAFEVSFKEILGNLILCHEYLPEEKQLPCLPFSSFLASVTLPSSKDMLSLIKARLDHFLVGTMSDKTREKYVKLFYGSFLDPGYQRNTIDIWVFMSVVLDEHFQELETHIAFPGSEPNTKLISIIAENSPLLEKLKLNFKLMKKNTNELQLKPLLLPLSSLDHLTHLHLGFLNNQIRTTVLSLIGASCSQLTHLTISGHYFDKKDVLALIFGEKIDELLPYYGKEPEWFQDEELECLDVSSEYLTPLCLTLQSLTLDWIEEGYTSDYVYPDAAVWTFLLRHVPSLQTLDFWCSHLRLENMLSCAIKRLYLVEQMKMKTKVEIACQRAAERLNNTPAQQFNIGRSLTSSFPGCCSAITKIDRVNVLDQVMLQAIGSFCPSLKEIVFYESSDYIHQSPGFQNIEDDASIEEIESTLKEWTMKVESVSCEEVSSECVKSILKVLGPGLQIFKWCASDQFSSSFSLESLLPCRQLVTVFLFRCFFNSTKPSATDVASFLPNLKDFRCSACLGQWSSLIENKPLRSLVLNCCHLTATGTGTNGPPAKRIKRDAKKGDSEWNKIPQLWGQQMTHLKILKCKGLTMASLFNLIRQFQKLEEVSLPDVVKMNESTELLSKAIMENLSQKMPSVKFTFTKPASKKCLFLDPK